MIEYTNKITALYSRLSVGDEDRDGGESGRFFDRSAYTQMISDVESGKVQHVTYCSEYAKRKSKHPKCYSPHRIDVDDVMENLTEVLRKIAQYSLARKEEFEALVKSSLAKEQTEEIKKQKTRIQSPPPIQRKFAVRF